MYLEFHHAKEPRAAAMAAYIMGKLQRYAIRFNLVRDNGLATLVPQCAAFRSDPGRSQAAPRHDVTDLAGRGQTRQHAEFGFTERRRGRTDRAVGLHDGFGASGIVPASRDRQVVLHKHLPAHAIWGGDLATGVPPERAGATLSRLGGSR